MLQDLQLKVRVLENAGRLQLVLDESDGARLKGWRHPTEKIESCEETCFFSRRPRVALLFPRCPRVALFLSVPPSGLIFVGAPEWLFVSGAPYRHFE